MISKIEKKMKKGALILALLMLFISINIFPLQGLSEEVKSCDEAYRDCMDDAPFAPLFIFVYVAHSIYCTFGFVYCKKYIEHQR